jgi:DNA invertase Pin-like site-specific DNA recombinase
MTKRVTIYARVSTKEQSVEMQLRDLKRYAKDRDLSLVKVYEEKASGMRADRPQFQKLLDDVRKRRTDAVLIWKLDRLARSTRELLNRLEEFRALGVELISYTENIDTATAAGKALFSMVAVFAEFENDIRRERITAGMELAKTKGKRIGRPALPHSEVAQVKQLRKEGLPDSEIIRRTGLSRNTVKKYAR